MHQLVFNIFFVLMAVLTAPCFAGTATGQELGVGENMPESEQGDAPVAASPEAVQPQGTVESAEDGAAREKEPALSEEPAPSVSSVPASVAPKAPQPDVPPNPPVPAGQIVIDGIVRRGDTAENIFVPNVGRDVFHDIMAASKKVYNLSSLRDGHAYRLICSSQNGFVSFEYYIDQTHRVIVTREKNGFLVEKKDIPYECKLTVVDGVIKSSLFRSLAKIGEKDMLGIHMANIFSSEINFFRDIQDGDRYTVVVEKRYHNGKFLKYGRILGIRFINDGKTYSGYLFEQPKGMAKYFNASGKSLHKVMLKAPLSFSSVTSGYTLRRKHPIFRDVRPHQGIDYAAPVGTPVKAVGDGVVRSVGWNRGFGRSVAIKHGGGLESMYSHLLRYAKGIKNGVKVRQGQVVGYVGSSGVSTGPHLDFRILKNGSFVNPRKVVSPRHDPIGADNRKSFAERKAFVDSVIDGKFDLSSYNPEMIN